MNLIVGGSGSGKTRLLNVLFNLARMGAGGSPLGPGKWRLEFENRKSHYAWDAEVVKKINQIDGKDVEVLSERLILIKDNDEDVEIFSQRSGKCVFGGRSVPKIIHANSGISAYREEETVKGAFDGLNLIQRRNFAGEDLTNGVAFQAFPYALIQKIALKKRRKIDDIYRHQISIHSKLYIIQQYFPSILKTISEQFKEIFPNFIKFSLTSSQHIASNIGFDAPVVLMHERGVDKGTPINEMASGMQKALMIISDVLTMPEDSVYMIDEYENSLGVNAINFLPLFLAEYGNRIQFLVTTHHPILINEIPTDDWLVFNRKASNIQVTYGEELAKKYGKSKQQLFVQLINDPSYGR